MDDDRFLDDNRLSDMMHRCGIRPSVNRLAVLSFVANRRTHPSADEIFTELQNKFRHFRAQPSTTHCTRLPPRNSFGTGIESGNRHYDLAPQPQHSHFICRRCSRIFDMPIPENLSGNTTPGFMIDSVELYFKGICPDCISIKKQ